MSNAAEAIPEERQVTNSIIVPVGEKKNRPNNGWTREQEDLIANWGDIASCYRLLHDKTEKRYYKFNLGMTIPVIMLSTMTGTANFGMGSLFGNDQASQRFANLTIGGVSLIAGLITTLGNFLRFAQNMESHRVASISWGKFQRSIAVELALHPSERQDSLDFLKICRAELDRLIEQSPAIPEKIIEDFEGQFADTAIKKPDICNHLERTHIYKERKKRSDGTDGSSYASDDDDDIGPLPSLNYSMGQNPALDRIQNFVVKARGTSPRNMVDLTGIQMTPRRG
jgi:hypothetical protein